MKFNQTYFHDVFKRSKWCFAVIVSFIVFIFFANLKRFNASPFSIWNVYSYPNKKDSFSIYSLRYNHNKAYNLPELWNHHKRMMFYYTIEWYHRCAANNFQDPLKQSGYNFINKRGVKRGWLIKKIYNTSDEIRSYPVWLKKYMASNIDEKIDSISVYKMLVYYTNNGELKVAKTNKLLSVH